MTELVNTPQEAIDIICENVYNFKIKCFACSESRFISYVPPVIQDGTDDRGALFPIIINGNDNNKMKE